MTAADDPGLRAELRAVEKVHPHWHVWVSSTGRLWAVTTYCPDRAGCGTTVVAGNAEGINREIAAVEHDWARAA